MTESSNSQIEIEKLGMLGFEPVPIFSEPCSLTHYAMRISDSFLT